MTYHNIYELKATPAAADGFTLYEAVKALAQAAADGLVQDATHIRCHGRCVAFWCAWRNQVRAMFEAGDDERKLINEWAFGLPTNR